jgi:hypothetical protein
VRGASEQYQKAKLTEGVVILAYIAQSSPELIVTTRGEGYTTMALPLAISPPATFSALAVELKLNVLEHLFRSGTDFTKALLVCKEWNEIGTPLLWANIALDNYNFIWFIRSLTDARSSSTSEIRNITLRITPFTTRPEHPLSTSALTLGFEDAEPMSCLYISEKWPNYLFSSVSAQSILAECNRDELDYLADHDAWYQCMILCTKRLSIFFQGKVNGLQIFSLRMEPPPCELNLEHYNLQHYSRFPIPVLAALLKTLPASCDSLELDTFELVDSSEFSGSCMDEALARVMPQLRHLRTAFDSTFTYCMSEHKGFAQLESLSLDVSQVVAFNNMFWEPRDGRTDLDAQNKTAADVKQAYSGGQFPNMKDLVCTLANSFTILTSPTGYMRQIDIVSERIDAFPSIEFRIDPDRHDTTEVWYTFFGNVPDHVKIIGLMPSSHSEDVVYMDKYMRNRFANNAWITSTNGCRFPRVMRNSREVRKHRLNFVDNLAGALSKVELLRRVTMVHGTAVGTAVFAQIQAQVTSLTPPTQIEGLLER